MHKSSRTLQVTIGCISRVALFPGPTYLSVACSMGEGLIGYHMSDVKGRMTVERLELNVGEQD